MASSLFIGIPVLNRADLLAACLEALDYPNVEILIINNSRCSTFQVDVERLCEKFGAQVRHQSHNLGVAASWNRIIQFGLGWGHSRIVIGSNDTILSPGSLERFALLPEPATDEVGIWHGHAFNFFAITMFTVMRVGWFDENFYPAYKEDQDYAYRCHLAGVRRADIEGFAANHIGSQTINSNPIYYTKNQVTHFNWNLNHYRMKWGGDANQERFVTPYNDPNRDWRWWPDPGGSIAHRDWDA